MAENLTLEMFMMTCREREHTRHATLRELGSTDWRSDFSLVVDPDITTGPGPVRLVRNFRRMLERASLSRAQVVVLVEDDLIFNQHLQHNIRAWSAKLEGVGSLYRTRLGSHVGMQGLVMTPHSCSRLARAAMATTEKEMWPTDKWLHSIVKVSRHTPSLVEHRDAGSTWGAIVKHHARDFDPEWRAP